jgi:hypothetical protein
LYQGYDDETREFRNIFFSNNGPFSEKGNRYEGVAEHGVLTFVGSARFQYALADDGTIRVNADGSIDVAWWLRDEHGAWTPWTHNRFTKVSR